MGFFESLITGIFCMVVVFAVLACLYFLISLFSFGLRQLESGSRKSTE